ncbi:MAG: dTMP kinase [Candidatus Micrarchaeota archaeon]|nr:dTMP kinase [Candidatus Micrarchaeota archaeon]
MIIAFEGIDGCGKGTQIEIVRKRLNCARKNYPDREGVFGGIFNSVLKGKAEFALDGPQLFLMFLMDMVKDSKLLERFKGNPDEHIVLDRYCHSTLAYQCAQGVDYELGKRIIEGFGLIKPDFVVIIDVPAEVSIKRLGGGEKEIFENEEFLEKVRANYLAISSESFFAERMATVSGEGTVEEVAKRIGMVLPVG